MSSPFSYSSKYSWPLAVGLLIFPAISLLIQMFYSLQTGQEFFLSPPLSWPGDRWMDFFNTNYWAIRPGRYTEWKSVHSPFALLMANGFALPAIFNYKGHSAPEVSQTMMGVLSYVALLSLFAYTCQQIIKRSLVHVPPFWRVPLGFAIGLFFFANVITWFAIDRGNYILLACVFLHFFLTSPTAGKWKLWWLAATISMKPYLILLVVIERQWWRLLVRIAVLNFGALVLLREVHLLDMLKNMTSFFGSYNLAEKLFSSLSAINLLLLSPSGPYSEAWRQTVQTYWMPLGVAVLLISFGLIRWRLGGGAGGDQQQKNLESEKWFFGILACLLLPMASFLYNAVLLFPFLPAAFKWLSERPARGLMLLGTWSASCWSLNYMVLLSDQLGKTGAMIYVTEQVLWTSALLLLLLIQLGYVLVVGRAPKGTL